MESTARRRVPICDNILSIRDLANIRNRGLVIFVFMLSLYRTAFGTMQNVLVYPSADFTRYFILYEKNLTWREAYHHCLNVGGSLASQGWSRDNTYIKNTLLREEWTATDNIWIGNIKYGHDNHWLLSRNCYITDNLEINNEINGELQCLSIDMTSKNKMKTLLYAASCDLRTAHICSFGTFKIEEATDVYTLYNNMTIHNESVDHTSVATSLDHCIIQVFETSCFECYGTEYFDSTNECHIYRRDLKSLPGTVTIMDSSDERILMLKKSHMVYIDNDTTPMNTANMSDLPLPCPVPTTLKSSALTKIETSAPTETSDLATSESETDIPVHITREAAMSTTETETLHSTIYYTSVLRTTVTSDTETTEINEMTTSDFTTTDLGLLTTVHSTVTTKETNTSVQITTRTSASVETMTQTFASLSNVELCPCDYNNTLSRPEEEIQREIEARKNELMVDPKTLSAYTRTKTSAKDDRVSSRTMGVLGVLLLSIVLLLLILNDIMSFLSYICRS